MDRALWRDHLSHLYGGSNACSCFSWFLLSLSRPAIFNSTLVHNEWFAGVLWGGWGWGEGNWLVGSLGGMWVPHWQLSVPCELSKNCYCALTALALCQCVIRWERLKTIDLDTIKGILEACQLTCYLECWYKLIDTFRSVNSVTPNHCYRDLILIKSMMCDEAGVDSFPPCHFPTENHPPKQKCAGSRHWRLNHNSGGWNLEQENAMRKIITPSLSCVLKSLWLFCDDDDDELLVVSAPLQNTCRRTFSLNPRTPGMEDIHPLCVTSSAEQYSRPFPTSVSKVCLYLQRNGRTMWTLNFKVLKVAYACFQALC